MERSPVVKEARIMDTVSVRYIVKDVDAALPFYRDGLGFEVVMHPGPGFAMLSRGMLRLLLNQPGAAGAGQDVSKRTPEPGGWNRFQLVVEDLDATVALLKSSGAPFRGDIIQGNGGRQVLVEDPSGNAIELFQPK
jgi:catechol 2,3-dioxygenase-like lactoylglutathione lyase family enzyme